MWFSNSVFLISSKSSNETSQQATKRGGNQLGSHMSCDYPAERSTPHDYERHSESSDGTGDAEDICPHLFPLHLSTVDSYSPPRYLRREDAFLTSSVPPIYSPCRRLLTTLMLVLMSVTFVLAVAAKMDAEEDVDAPAKDADLGCSTTAINCSIIHSM
ncbi:unnamed protein product [Taenia asiatica]|uniref:Membrane protein UL56 n=1 Tax=Taenia asiatica TaxID=60517 RepID=A0A0R3WEL9_TAEAS|nr:unnamed protein product [Taenia asiatica]